MGFSIKASEIPPYGEKCRILPESKINHQELCLSKDITKKYSGLITCTLTFSIHPFEDNKVFEKFDCVKHVIHVKIWTA